MLVSFIINIIHMRLTFITYKTQICFLLLIILSANKIKLLHARSIMQPSDNGVRAFSSDFGPFQVLRIGVTSGIYIDFLMEKGEEDEFADKTRQNNRHQEAVLRLQY